VTNPKAKPIAGTVEFINTAIASIAKKGKALDSLIQATGIDVLDWAHKNNDLDMVNRFVASIPPGSKKTSLVIWLCEFGKLKPNDDKETKDGKPVVWRKDGVLNLEAARAKLWHSCVKEKDPSEVFDIEQAFASFMKRVLAAEKTGKVNNPVILAALKNVKGTSEVAKDAAVGGVSATLPIARV
jgi:hypothetical protein